MKNKYIYLISCGLFLGGLFTSCNDMLNIEPPSQVVPEEFFKGEAQIGDYTNKLYEAIEVKEPYASDGYTDIQVNKDVPSRYTKTEWRVPSTGSDWNFDQLHEINYFIETVKKRLEDNVVEGNLTIVDHYVGEVYFFRALHHYNKLKTIGDAPIIDRTYTEQDKELLIIDSKRYPRSTVARFILEDLDKAESLLLKEAPDKRKNRINKAVAMLLKSRVALNEGTWLKYFKGTAFVPNGPDWPGKQKEYNKDFEYESGSIDNEINFFLEEAYKAADFVAADATLTENSGYLPQSITESNPYVEMFGATDMSQYDEVLLWKAYDSGLGITNNISINASTSNQGQGVTKGMVDTYLMKNGLPRYATGSGYQGDESIGDVRANRDTRATLFLKEPGQLNYWINTNMGTHGAIQEPILPNITAGSAVNRFNTGYTNRKGFNPDKSMANNWGGYTGCIIYRSAEALLNYIEAYYERHGNLDSKATAYWNKLRERAGITGDIQTTINATDMNEEAKGSWAAYSGGELVDATLYNIRRERISEFMAEGYHMENLKRWRSMDQLIQTPFHIEGFKVWGTFYKDAYAEAGKTDPIYALSYDVNDPKSNVSSPDYSLYLRPYQIVKTLAFDGFTWQMAHYLNPIAINHFLISSEDGKTISSSPIYQNPNWPVVADRPATK